MLYAICGRYIWSVTIVGIPFAFALYANSTNKRESGSGELCTVYARSPFLRREVAFVNSVVLRVRIRLVMLVFANECLCLTCFAGETTPGVALMLLFALVALHG